MFIKSIKSILIAALFMFFMDGLFAQSQGIGFFYEKETGCRVKREIITLKNVTVNNDSVSTKKAIVKYNDLFENIKVTIYPNPNGGKFKVKLTGIKQNQKAVFSLSTITGKIIYKERYYTNVLVINIENEKSGSYILYLNVDGKLKSWEIIKL